VRIEVIIQKTVLFYEESERVFDGRIILRWIFRKLDDRWGVNGLYLSSKG